MRTPLFCTTSGIMELGTEDACEATAAMTAGLIIRPDSVSGWLAMSYASEYSMPRCRGHYIIECIQIQWELYTITSWTDTGYNFLY